MSIKPEFENLQKMDKEIAALLQRIRTGQTRPEDADLLHEKFHQDTMIPAMRNKMAYQDHLETYGNAGIHAHVDMNDFGQVNKFYGEPLGDEAIKSFGNLAHPIAQKYGGRSFHNGGDEFKFWFLEPDHAHRFARDLQTAMDDWSSSNKFQGPLIKPEYEGLGVNGHRMAASIGIGYNRDHAEKALVAAKDRLGPKNIFGNRENKHSMGQAPSEICSLTHEDPPEGWKTAEAAIAENKAPSGMAPTGDITLHMPGTTATSTKPGASAAYVHTEKPSTSPPHNFTYHNPLAKQEPLVQPTQHFGIMTAENPYEKNGGLTSKHLQNELSARGFKFEPAPGKSDNSLVIHGPSVEDMEDLGQRYGQKSVTHSIGGTNKTIYTNGPRAGTYGDDSGTFTPMRRARSGIKHPHAYDWHDGHTRHYLTAGKRMQKTELRIAPRGFVDPKGTLHEIDSGDTHHDWIHRTVSGTQLEGRDDDESYQNALKAGWLSVGIGAGDFSEGHNVQGTVEHLSNRNHPATRAVKKIAYSHWGPHFEAMVHHPEGNMTVDNFDTHTFIRRGTLEQSLDKAEANDQAAPVGVSTYAQFAAPYGTIAPGTKTNLMHYDYRPFEDSLDQMIKKKGYKTEFFGGKYGKGDLATKNFNTGHLMIYDPSPESGANNGEEDYTRSWRKAHELSHALTYRDVNAKYGEGRRIGKLGVHRTTNEAKRSLEWEWLAAHKQREISAQLGHHISDDVFHQELNAVMHDAVHRAITGKFSDFSREGFTPHSHKVPLEHALGVVDQHAQQMGLAGDHALIQKPLAAPKPAAVTA